MKALGVGLGRWLSTTSRSFAPIPDVRHPPARPGDPAGRREGCDRLAPDLSHTTRRRSTRWRCAGVAWPGHPFLVIPVTTPDEIGRIDADAPEPVEVLIGRAGGALGRAALDLLGGTLGAGSWCSPARGTTGTTGVRPAGAFSGGVRVTEVDVADAPEHLPPADLVIDAAFGTGFSGEFDAPETDAPVLACDIPSGVDGLTGEAENQGASVRAVRTVTFAAMKPGLLFREGPNLAGERQVADIGLDVVGRGDARRGVRRGRLVPGRTRRAQVAFGVLGGGGLIRNDGCRLPGHPWSVRAGEGTSGRLRSRV